MGNCGGMGVGDVSSKDPHASTSRLSKVAMISSLHS